jgi:HK97 gp10 family phage protein
MSNLLSVNFQYLQWSIGRIAKRYAELPRHIAKKHTQAALKRALSTSRAVQTLKANTPKGKAYYVRRGVSRSGGGQFVKGSGGWSRQPAGALRRSVTLKSKYIGTNASGAAIAVVGYKYGPESRKGIWLEFGTRRMRPVAMVDKTMRTVGPAARSALLKELREALVKAVREVAGGRNPDRVYGAGGVRLK